MADMPEMRRVDCELISNSGRIPSGLGTLQYSREQYIQRLLFENQLRTANSAHASNDVQSRALPQGLVPLKGRPATGKHRPTPRQLKRATRRSSLDLALSGEPTDGIAHVDLQGAGVFGSMRAQSPAFRD